MTEGGSRNTPLEGGGEGEGRRGKERTEEGTSTIIHHTGAPHGSSRALKKIAS